MYKLTGPHEVDFVIGNGESHVTKGGGEVNRKGGLIVKTDFQTGGLLDRGLIEREEGA